MDHRPPSPPHVSTVGLDRRRAERCVVSLAEAMQRLTSCRDADLLLEALLDGLVRGLGFERAALWQLDASGTVLELFATRGGLAPVPRAAPLAGPDAEPTLSAVVRDRKPALWPDPGQPLLGCYARAGLAPEAYAVLPLDIGGRTERRRYRDRRRRRGAAIRAALLVEPLASASDPILATYLRTASLMAERILHDIYLEDVSRRDGLTGLWNRREVIDRLIRATWSARGGRVVGLLFADLDHFKRVNDTHGHEVGDRVLERVARAIVRAVRDFDVVGRIGGEELVVLLPSTSRRGLEAAAERLRNVVASLDLDDLARGLRTTVSIGGALFPEDARTPRGLLRAADEALYRAKALGRDRVVLAAAR